MNGHNVQIDLKSDSRVCQGDLIRNVACIEDVVEQGDTIEVKRIVFPLVVVLTQDCDLQQDDSNRLKTKGASAPTDHNTQILSILVAPAYNATHFELGEHLSELGLKMWAIPTKGGKGSTDQRILRQNKNPRYHYLQFDNDSKIVDSVVDFKHYFAVNGQYLKRIKSENFAGKLSPLYREDVSQRFASFLARIGLPDPPVTSSK